MNRHLPTLLLICVTPCLSGCLTPALWEGYLDSVNAHEPLEVPAVRPQRLLRASRSASGDYVIEARYTDSSVRAFAFRPQPAPAWPKTWAKTGPERARGELPELRAFEGSYPLPSEGWVEVEVDPIPDRAVGPTTAAPARLRLCQGRLEFREGHAAFRQVAHFPWEPATHTYVQRGFQAGDFALGALVVLTTPVAASLDLAGIATLIGLILI